MTGFTSTEANKMDVEIKRLRDENAELKAHIKRWAILPDQKHKEKGRWGFCENCELPWPCPTKVIKELENE